MSGTQPSPDQKIFTQLKAIDKDKWSDPHLFRGTAKVVE